MLDKKKRILEIKMVNNLRQRGYLLRALFACMWPLPW